MPTQQILNRWTGVVLWEGEAESLGAAVVIAVGSGAYLTGANLTRANLTRADLTGANLTRADLTGANLTRANLTEADLAGANLTGANLAGAYLTEADLAGANLTEADLAGANLTGADLAGAYLTGAYLTRANLTGATGINPYRTTDLLMLLDQPGPIVAYKLVNESGEGHCRGGINYLTSDEWAVPNANTDPLVECGAGINVATLPWCMRDWQPGYRILKLQFTAQDIACIPTATDGKFRLFRAQRVGEVDLVQVGLVEDAEVAA